MNELLNRIDQTTKHLRILHELFSEIANYQGPNAAVEHSDYMANFDDMHTAFSNLMLYDELYEVKGRQMILADMLEYILLGRGFYSVTQGNARDKMRKRGEFVKGVIRLVNLLMSYDSITVDVSMRRAFLRSLGEHLPTISNEPLFNELISYDGKIGIQGSDAPKELEKYFDKLLPKTAGGLWHELLVYIFMLREDFGYIVPLLLHQKLLSRSVSGRT